MDWQKYRQPETPLLHWSVSRLSGKNVTETTREYKTVHPLPDCDPVIGAALWGIEDARQRTREALQSFNPAALEALIDGKGHSASTLLYHIAAIELDWLYAEVLEQRFEGTIMQHFPYDVRDKQGRLTVVTGESLESLWARLDAVRALLLQTYKVMSLAEYRRPRTLEHYDVTPEWVLHHLMQHEAEHRDELRRLREYLKR
jgi:uncharacterized damage-inducible protein DinB